MSSNTLDLGPGDIASAYDIPASDWEIANKRVSVILDPSRDPALQAKLKALPNYDQLVAVSSQWKQTTFNSLVDFASKLNTFSQTDVQSYLTVLGMIVEALNNGDTSMQERLNNTVAGLEADTSEFTSVVDPLATELKNFDQQMTQADIGGGDPNDPIWSNFSLNAGMAFDVINGRFQTISSDLLGLKNSVDEKIKKDLPIVVKLVDLPIAKDRWISIGTDATAFVSNAPAQRKYLDGNW